jgi:hypothetical protein
MIAHSRMSLVLPFICLALGLGLPGCGDDDDDNPMGPEPPSGHSEFDQSTAVSQASTAAPQAVALVQSMTVLAGGFSPRSAGGDTYSWNETTGRWEWHYIWDQTGYDYDWFYTVQYLDAQGTPQQQPTGAATIAHTMNGTGDYHQESDGTVVDYNYAYTYSVSTTGLGTEALRMAGTGGWDFDYAWSNGSQSQAYSYEIGWQTLDDVITIPLGGCPTGTIRYTFAPYHLDIVFNGTSTAVATLYDGNGSIVTAGGSNQPVACN